MDPDLIPRSAQEPFTGYSHYSNMLGEHEPLTIDDIISHLGFKSYQIKAYLVLGLILVNDGAESLVLSILQNVLKNEWQLTSEQIELLGTTVFIGFLLGSVISGKIADRYGRRRPLLFLAIALYICGLGSAIVMNFLSLVIVRAAYGFLVGIQFPMCFTYLAEITPKESRGRWLVVAGSFFTFGQLLTCAVSSFTLEGISSGNWRLLLLCIAQPAIICWLGIVFLLKESPRYLIVTKKEISKGIEIFNEIARQNNESFFLEEDDIEDLDKWLQSHHNLKDKQVASIRALFKGRTKTLTVYLWIVWFILSLTYYGMVYILPQVIDSLHNDHVNPNDHSELWSITLPVIGELPSVLLAMLVIEKDHLGRRRSMIIGFTVTAILCVLAGTAPYFNFWITVARALLNGVFIIVAPFTTEVYPTTIRTTGLGMASAFSRVGGAVMPWITQSLFEIGPRMPFIGFAGFCAIGSVSCLMIPYDTTKKELDFEYEVNEDTLDKDGKYVMSLE